jgi:hypothetical protein
MVRAWKEPALPLARTGGARDHDHRRSLGIGARDRIDDVERTRAIGHDGNADAAVKARRCVRRKTHGRLMTQFVMRQDARLLDGLVERQHEIAGDAEDFAGAMRLQRAQQNRCESGHAKLSHGGGFTTIAAARSSARKSRSSR